MADMDMADMVVGTRARRSRARRSACCRLAPWRQRPARRITAGVTAILPTAGGMGIPTTVEVTVTPITPAVTAIRPTAGGMGIPTTAEVTATPITARLRITAGRMVITGGLMPATRAIVITGLTTSQAIGVTRITGGKTIANMATGRTGSMRTGAAFIRDA